MARISRTPAQARQNLEASLSVVESRYRTGVESAEWAAPTISEQAEQNYRSGLDEAIAADRRRAGVRAKGDAGYRAGALGKGARNIVAGIRGSLSEYEEGMRPVMERVERVKQSMPAKTRDADQNIDNRLKPIVRAQQNRS